MNSNGKSTDLPLLARARLVPLRDQGTLENLVQAAAADQHVVIVPTHVMMRGQSIIGYVSLGAMPVLQAWFDSKAGHALDSLKMIETAEAVLATQGVKCFAVAVSEDSPFAPHMARLGYTELGKTVLWHKTL